MTSRSRRYEDPEDLICYSCKEKFESKHARDQHCRDANCPGSDSEDDIKARVEVFEDIADDFSDGAYWAYAAEQGLDVEDITRYGRE